MRIDSNLAVLPIKADSQPKAKAGDKPPESTVVTLSAGATASVAAKPVDVTGRLEKIRALLDKGEYPVDLDKLASRIVDDDASRGRGSAS